MKRFNFFMLCCIFVFASCKELQNVVPNEESSSDNKITLIASNAKLLITQNEILSSLNKPVRSVACDIPNILSDSDLSEHDIVELTKFSSSPSSYITENIDFNETVSNNNLNLLYSIYNESTVDNVISNMEIVSLEMAEDYKKSVSEFYNTLDASAQRAIDNNGGIGSQKLYILQNDSNDFSARAITFETDLSWTSVARYTGYSVAAIAGACCYKWGILPWIRYPGLAVCISGIGCMGTLIARWACSPKLAIITASVKSIASSVSKIKDLTELTDEEKEINFFHR